jgi:hypothetical protein
MPGFIAGPSCMHPGQFGLGSSWVNEALSLNMYEREGYFTIVDIYCVNNAVLNLVIVFVFIVCWVMLSFYCDRNNFSNSRKARTLSRNGFIDTNP